MINFLEFHGAIVVNFRNKNKIKKVNLNWRTWNESTERISDVRRSVPDLKIYCFHTPIWISANVDFQIHCEFCDSILFLSPFVFYNIIGIPFLYDKSRLATALVAIPIEILQVRHLKKISTLATVHNLGDLYALSRTSRRGDVQSCSKALGLERTSTLDTYGEIDDWAESDSDLV